MGANINLFKQSWLIRKKVQRRLFIFLIIAVLTSAIIYLHLSKRLSEVSSESNFQSNLILSQIEKEDLIQLRGQLSEQTSQAQVNISLAYWDKLITELLGEIAQIERLTYADMTLVITGELKAYSDFQVLTTRAADLRTQGVKISVNKIGPLNQGQFILTLQGEE
ncbi:MAG: hypothetical protein ACQEQG_01445 [Bacillota bacterium]